MFIIVSFSIVKKNYNKTTGLCLVSFFAVAKLFQHPKTNEKNDLFIKQTKIKYLLYGEFLSDLYKQHQVCYLI
jgi:hypothetical protein